MTLPERDLGYLEDIRANAADALTIAEGRSFDEFPQFPWSAMKGMRHILVHEYGRVDYEKVWDVITTDLPRLRIELARYLGALP